jgi:alpha-1,3-mannosyltransferase
MKILHFTNRYWPALGGIENVVDNLCKELQKKGIKSDVLTLNKVDGKKLKRYDTKGKTKIFRIQHLDLKYYKVSTIPFSLFRNYDIIHLHSLNFLSDIVLLTKFLHKKKIIVSTHGGIFHTNKIPGLKRIYFYIIEKQLLKNADKIVAISKQDKKKFEEISNNVMLIENGFNAPEPRGKKEKNLFLTVGRISRNKNLEKLIEVFGELDKKYKLKIVGRDFDNLIPKLKKQIKEKNLNERIELIPGATDTELVKFYSKAEYFVSASKYEGFGITAIEAMHYNCKTILNAIPTYKDFAKNGNGSIVDFSKTNTTNKLEKAIKKKVDLKKAKKHADSFLWKKKIDEFVELYRSF